MTDSTLDFFKAPGFQRIKLCIPIHFLRDTEISSTELQCSGDILNFILFYLSITYWESSHSWGQMVVQLSFICFCFWVKGSAWVRLYWRILKYRLKKLQSMRTFIKVLTPLKLVKLPILNICEYRKKPWVILKVSFEPQYIMIEYQRL